jgi:hypothetical protein
VTEACQLLLCYLLWAEAAKWTGPLSERVLQIVKRLMNRRHEELKLREEGRAEGKARKIKTIQFPDKIKSISTYSLHSVLFVVLSSPYRRSNYLYFLRNFFLVPRDDKLRLCKENVLRRIIGMSMLGGPLVTTAWRVLRLRMEETPSSFGG